MGITKDGDAQTSKVITFKPQPFTHKNFDCLCQEVKEMLVSLGILNMLAKARFKEHIKASKHTHCSLYKIEDY